MQHSFVRMIALIGLFASLAVAGGLYSPHLRLSRANPSRDPKSLAIGQKSTDSSLQPCSVLPKKKEKLNASQAVRLAECFIVQNGYTEVAPTENESHLAPESVNSSADELGKRMRRDSLEPNAYGYARGTRDPDGWTVLFRKKYKAELAKLIPNYEERIKKTGRAVTMDVYGQAIEVEHQDFCLDFPGVKKLSPLTK